MFLGPLFEWLMANKGLALALTLGGYGLWKGARHKPPTDQEVANAVNTAIPPRQMVMRRQRSPLGELFQHMGDQIRKNADKLTTKDVNNLMTVMAHFVTPIMQGYASQSGMKGLLNQARLANLDASTQQKIMNNRLMSGATSANQQAASQYFGGQAGGIPAYSDYYEAPYTTPNVTPRQTNALPVPVQ